MKRNTEKVASYILWALVAVILLVDTGYQIGKDLYHFIN